MRNIIIISVLSLFLLLAYIGCNLYVKVFGDNVSELKEEYTLCIPTGAIYADVLELLLSHGIVKNLEEFDWVAQKMNYPNHVNPGRYIITDKMSNRELITILRSGSQVPIQLMLGKFRTKQDLAGYVSFQLEADSSQLVQLLNDELFLSELNVNSDNVLSIFIPNKYEFYWNTNAEKFLKRMHREYERFWYNGREQLARKNNLDPFTATTLASIVEEESYREDERPAIAGVYLNRLKRNMRLQADPTVKFALQNFELKRILKRHTNYDSPFNTYRITGLPPGPICTPSISSIEAVLNPQKHEFLFFCARHDFSGYHAFATTYKEHMENARRYQSALNENNIK